MTEADMNALRDALRPKMPELRFHPGAAGNLVGTLGKLIERHEENLMNQFAGKVGSDAALNLRKTVIPREDGGMRIVLEIPVEEHPTGGTAVVDRMQFFNSRAALLEKLREVIELHGASCGRPVDWTAMPGLSNALHDIASDVMIDGIGWVPAEPVDNFEELIASLGDA